MTEHYVVASETIAEFGNKKVLVIGDVMVDQYLYGSVDRISPEAPVPVLKYERDIRKLGGAANVALNLKALGATVSVCGIVKDDEAGRWLCQELKKKGISNDCVGSYSLFTRYHSVVKGSTITKTRIVAGTQQICRIDRESPSVDERGFIFTLDFSGYDAIFVSDYGKGLVTDDLLDQVRSTGIPFYCDPKDSKLSKYAGAWGITPNEKEARAFEFPFPSESLPDNLDRLNIKTCLVTRGENGVHYWDIERGNGVFLIGAHHRELADACGAGDTAFAVYGLSKTCGAPTGISAGLANLAGSLVCEHFGVVPITRMTLVAALPEGV